MLFHDLAVASQSVAATTKRNEKVAILAEVLARLDPAEIIAGTAYLTGTTPSGKIGIGWATLAEVRPEPVPTAVLSIAEVDATLGQVAASSGEGVAAARRALLGGLFGAMTRVEQGFVRGILGGELRQGALDGVMATAIAAAAGVPVRSVRRAAMMAGDLNVASSAALSVGREGLDAIDLEPMRPVQPMLASPSRDVTSAVESMGRVQVDWKLDGVRVQAHRVGDVVRLFTRNLNDITERLPHVVDTVRGFAGGDLVLDGEAMGIMDDGSPHRFQDSMKRSTGLEAFFFDVLAVDGAPVHERPLAERRELLAAVVPDTSRLPSIITDDPGEAEAFLTAAIAAGHEGVMIKDLALAYEAGRRGQGWRKVKPVHTLDLVVLAVEWGSGRRRGWLSNLHLGARDPERPGEFVMLGKTFKGMNDEMLRWQTDRFEELRIGDIVVGGRRAVSIRPEQVVEIAIDGVQHSTTYPGGVALRFARVVRYRDDKVPGEADTLAAVRALLDRPGAARDDG
jgi:DNA ligase-1